MGALATANRTARSGAALAAVVLAAAACGSGTSTALTENSAVRAPARAAVARPAHVAVIVLENEVYGDVIGSRSAPYINRLAKTYSLITRMYGISHPSLPNYLALTGGSTFGIHDDCTDCAVNATSIVDQLEGAGVSWKGYMENLPYPCYTGDNVGPYAKRHNPFVYYTPITDDPSRCAKIVPLSQLYADESRHALPQFIWITPNVCNDAHDCSIAAADRFLSQLVPGLLRQLGSHGRLFLTWDEGSDNSGCCRIASGGRIPTVVAGPGARRGARLNTPVDLYSVLRAIEDGWRLPRLRNAACSCTPSLAGLLS